MLNFLEHALRRMRERGISKADVQFCLDNHDVVFEAKKGYSLYIAKHPNGRRIQVVTNVKTNEVVTVVWLD